MKGILIVNHFLDSEKFSDIYARLCESAQAHGASLTLMTNRDLMHVEGEALPFPFPPDFILFWDKDILLAEKCEKAGFPVFNSSSAIAASDNKAIMHRRLYGLPMPKTIIAPMTFPNIGYKEQGFLDEVGKSLGFPLVVKECCGSFGREVYLAKNISSLREIVAHHGNVPLLFQELIRESFGRDIRINVVGGRVVAAMLRESTNGDFRSNITLGGCAYSYSPSDEERALAISAAEMLGLDFAGVDILFGKDDTPILCEVNSNAHFKSTLDYTGVNMADHIMTHIIKKLGDKRK